MLKNYIKIAYRNLFRNKLYGAINILGLALGLASSFVIGTWVYQELSYDRHFENADRIYRVGTNFFNVGDLANGPEIFDAVAEEFPEVAVSTSLNRASTSVKIDDQEFAESLAFEADKDFFDMFSFHFKKGNPETALDHPSQVVLTETLAQKFFGRQEAMGKTILIDEDEIPHTVVGIVAESGQNTHFTATMWISLERDPERTSWTSAHYYNYVLLNPGFTQHDLESRLDQLIEDEIHPSLGQNAPFEDWFTSSSAYKFSTTPLTDLYLKTNFRFDFFTSGNATNVYSFAAIALFIILLAAINFVNISTARSSGRAKEVGIRKTLGSGRATLVGQFLAESILMSLLALVLALGMGEIFLKLFEETTGIHLLNSLFIGPGQITVFIALAIFMGLAAGLYPAFYLSAFKPVSMLKNQFGGLKKSWFRNGLVITQFTISICLIVAVGVVYQQLTFLQNQDLGFDTENVLVIDNASSIGPQQESFKQEAESIAGISEVSYNRRMPVGRSIWVQTYRTPEMSEGKPYQTFFGDNKYLNTLGFQLLEGRNFSEEIAGDTAAVILNESAVRELELDDPIGTQLNDNLEVIGVVSDFNYESLHKPVEPAAIMYSTVADRMAIKMDGSRADAIIAGLENAWDAYNTGESMTYYFLDQRFQETLDNERSLGKAISLFTIFAIVISCLGLFGLSSYICEQRTKEIGIRKVLGAAVSSLVIFLNRDFTKLILISIAIATPMSYILMSKWLTNFAYRIEIGPLLFVMAGLLALLISWITVSGQSIKTALMNPVESLRSE
jgi:putative ABC transport system permease protein